MVIKAVLTSGLVEVIQSYNTRSLNLRKDNYALLPAQIQSRTDGESWYRMGAVYNLHLLEKLVFFEYSSVFAV